MIIDSTLEKFKGQIDRDIFKTGNVIFFFFFYLNYNYKKPILSKNQTIIIINLLTIQGYLVKKKKKNRDRIKNK